MQRAAHRLLAVAVLLLGPTVVPKMSIERPEVPPPGELSAEIRATLSPKALRIVSERKPRLEYWLRREIPVVAARSAALGVAYPSLREGTLVGALRIPEPWTDYRGTKVPAGVYTLRYGLQPVDGSHTGVSEYRDFLMLVASSLDTDAAASYQHDRLVELGRKTSGAFHAGVMALFPVTDPVTDPVILANDLGQPMVGVKVGALTLGMVLQGTGDAAVLKQ
jgi:hypothetical protein